MIYKHPPVNVDMSRYFSGFDDIRFSLDAESTIQNTGSDHFRVEFKLNEPIDPWYEYCIALDSFLNTKYNEIHNHLSFVSDDKLVIIIVWMQ